MNSNIFIVDDDASSRDTLESILYNQGYALHFAENGQQALQKMETLRPDLIILDVMMPGMDGFEVCRHIRATAELAEIPIILLTALDDHASRLKGIEAGADDFLSKPIERQELRARVHTITRLNRYRIMLDQRESLREMAQHLVNAQEEERLRISRELHDELGQSLTAHLIGLRLLSSDLPLPITSVRERLNKLSVDTIETLNRMRLLAQDLRPPIIDTLDLASALRSYCQEFGRRSRMPIQFEAEPIPSISDTYAITFYRFLQESLTNIIRHAHASQAWVELTVDDNNLLLIVQDNGQGIDPSVSNSKGIGIQGLKERLTVVGGKLTIRSIPERGTIITACLPIEKTEAK